MFYDYVCVEIYTLQPYIIDFTQRGCHTLRLCSFSRQWQVDRIRTTRMCSCDLTMYEGLIKGWPNLVSYRCRPWARELASLLVLRDFHTSAHYTSCHRDNRWGNWLWNVESMRGRRSRPCFAEVFAAAKKITFFRIKFDTCVTGVVRLELQDISVMWRHVVW